MEQWYLYKKKADFTKIGEKFQIDPVIARLIRNRDVIGDEEIHKYLFKMGDNQTYITDSSSY